MTMAIPMIMMDVVYHVLWKLQHCAQASYLILLHDWSAIHLPLPLVVIDDLDLVSHDLVSRLRCLSHSLQDGLLHESLHTPIHLQLLELIWVMYSTSAIIPVR